MKVKTGLENFLENPLKSIHGKRLGLLCNHASVHGCFHHARDLLNKRFPGSLKALYSPQHGFFAEKQDNMIESDTISDPVLKIPIFSLYGKTRKPGKEMLDMIDVLLIDLQDVGTRVYTFIYTMSYCLEAAKQFGKRVIVLDRPNPLNGVNVEGNLLKSRLASFVGRYPIPMRYGLTIGEIAMLFNDYFCIGADLSVIRMKQWRREMYFGDTGLYWVGPSPNLPTPGSAYVYPGQVLWEGTNISEGRGTTLPFELFGAPFINVEKIMSSLKIKGIVLRPAAFEPVANKWKKNLCLGFQIHITDVNLYQPYIVTLRLIREIIINHQDKFRWKLPPYEYEYEKLPIDLIIGDRTVRKRLENHDSIESIEVSWQEDLESFCKIKKEFHLY